MTAERDVANACRACPSLCERACPVSAVAREATPWAKMLRAAEALAGGLAPAEAAWLDWCTHCHACTDVCPASVPVADVLALAAARASGPEAGQAAGVDLHAWRELGVLRGDAAVVLDVGGASEVDAAALTAWLLARGAADIHVLPGFSLGEDLLASGRHQAFETLAAVIDGALGEVRVVAVAGGDALRALTAMQAAGRLRRVYLTLLDAWLARFGLPGAADAVRLEPCRTRRPGVAGGPSQARPQGQTVAGSALWPPAAACCGAALPLARAAPEAADAAARQVLAALVAQGARAVHVEDMQCAAHLRKSLLQQGLPLRLEHRAGLLARGGR